MKIKDKVVVVTGGAGLLGRSFCKLLAEEGAIPVVADVNLAAAQEVVDQAGLGLAVEMDITSSNSVESAISAINDKYGRIDALVNSAYPRNKNYGRKFWDVEYEDFCENLNLNLGGYFLTSKLFLSFFKQQGSGKVINLSSIYGVVAPKFEIYEGTEMTMPVEYAAIKSGLIQLTKYMAKSVAGQNIQVNCISPGGILDGQPEAFLKKYNDKCISKGMLDAGDLFGTLHFLISSGSNYVNGQNIIVDDGFSL